MSFQTAKVYLTNMGLEKQIMEFSVSSKTVKDASLALHCQEAEIAKTMAFFVGGNPILIVTSGDQRIDNSKFKQEFHEKAKMIPSGELEDVIGYSMGGICPFGVPSNVVVYLDVSLQRFDRVFPACGSDHSAVSLTIPELEKSSRYEKWIDVCKPMEEKLP